MQSNFLLGDVSLIDLNTSMNLRAIFSLFIITFNFLNQITFQAFIKIFSKQLFIQSFYKFY